MSWPPGHVLFPWDASSSPKPKARMHKTEMGPPCQRGVSFGRNPSPVQEGDAGAAKPELLDGAWKPTAKSFKVGVRAWGPRSAPPQKIHMGRWARSKAPYGLPMFSIHPYHARLHQLQGRSHTDLGTVHKAPSPAPAAALLPSLP